MAKMLTINPAISLDLDAGWQLVATEAGRYADGLRTTVMLQNGMVQDVRALTIAQPQERAKYAQTVAEHATIAIADIERKILELFAAVEGALRAQAATEEAERQSQASRLVELALAAGLELFHSPDGEPYATLAVEGHTETWALRTKNFKRWLARLFYAQEEKTIGGQGLQDACAVLEAQACFDGPEHAVALRVAAHQYHMYLDLGNEAWEYIAMSPQGWNVVDAAPMQFRRSRGLLPLPTPQPGGDLALLKRFVNIDSDDDWRLLVSWLLAALRPTGPYPVLVVHAEQGAGKSTLCRILRSLIDPNTANLRTTPRDERDLLIAAHNSWLIALDNLSHLSNWLSDALCRLATGSGFATRELYTDSEEAIFAAQRPIVLNGIEELATRGDLLDRSVILYLPTIPEDKRQDEEKFWQEFEAARPQILGALLDIICQGMAHLPSVQLQKLPRMADFAKWACAIAPACGWTEEDFLQAYQAKREASYSLTLEASPVGTFLCGWFHTLARNPWEGTASELLGALEQAVQASLTTSTSQSGSQTVKFTQAAEVTKQKTWPKNGRALSNTLRRLAPTLRAVGINIEHTRDGHAGRRIIRLERITMPFQNAPHGRVQGMI